MTKFGIAVFVFWLVVVLGLTLSRPFVVGVLDNSPASLYKDAAHFLFAGGFVYACFKTEDALWGGRKKGWWPLNVDRKLLAPVACLWILLIVSVVAEVVFAIRDNPSAFTP